MPSSQPLPPKENALFKRILVRGYFTGIKIAFITDALVFYCYRKATNKSSIRMG